MLDGRQPTLDSQAAGAVHDHAQGLQPYSLFHYLDPKAVLTTGASTFDFGLLAGVALVAIVAALVIFPRRDLAAPS